MTHEKLIEANQLQQEIRELDYFIFCAKSHWTGQIIKKVDTYIFRADPYGGLETVNFNMNTAIKNRVLDLLRDYLKELEARLENI